MWGSDEDDVKIFEDDSTRAGQSKQAKQLSVETLVWTPVIWAWILSTREITAGDAFRFWAQCNKKWGGNQILIGRDVGAEVGMWVVPSRFASQHVVLDAGGYCGELLDVQDSGYASTCYVKWLCSATKGGPYSLPNRWLEEANASSFQLAVPTDSEKERTRDYVNEMEYERSMAEARRTQLISKWGRLAEKGVFGMDVLARRVVWDKKADKEMRELERLRELESEKEQQELIERLEAEGRESEITRKAKQKPQTKREKKIPRTRKVQILRRLKTGEVVEEEVLEEASDSDDDAAERPGKGMKVIIPRLPTPLVKRTAKRNNGPFPTDVCCRQLEQNELFCLPSAGQKMITANLAKAACVLQLCSHRATSPSGQLKAFPLRKALQARKCCVLIVRDCTEEAVLQSLLEEVIQSMDDKLAARLAADESKHASPARPLSAFHVSRRPSTALSPSHLEPSTRQQLSPLPGRAAASKSAMPPRVPPPNRSKRPDALVPRDSPVAGDVRGAEGKEAASDGWCAGQAVPGMQLPDFKYDIEMLLLQRVDLVHLQGMRKLLALLQHRECKIETLICIRAALGEEGSRLLSQAMQGQRTRESGTNTPIAGVSVSWEGTRQKRKTRHDGRADLGLSTMVLQQCGIGEQGATHLAEALHRNQTLTLLDLSNNGIGKRGVGELARSLVHASPLDHLGLHGNGVDAEAMRWLQQAIGRRWHKIAELRKEAEERQAIQQALDGGQAASESKGSGPASAVASPVSVQTVQAVAGNASDILRRFVTPKVAAGSARNLHSDRQIDSVRVGSAVAQEQSDDDGDEENRRSFTLVTGSLEMPVVLHSFEPAADAAEEEAEERSDGEMRGMQREEPDPRWEASDKQWTGIMEWQVRQRGWEEGRRGWSLVPPARKAERLERQAALREQHRWREEEAARRQAEAEEQSWMAHAEAEGYQFLSFTEDGKRMPGFASPLAGRPTKSVRPQSIVVPGKAGPTERGQTAPPEQGAVPPAASKPAQTSPIIGRQAVQEKTRETVATSHSRDTLLSQKDTTIGTHSEDWSAADASMF